MLDVIACIDSSLDYSVSQAVKEDFGCDLGSQPGCFSFAPGFGELPKSLSFHNNSPAAAHLPLEYVTSKFTAHACET